MATGPSTQQIVEIADIRQDVAIMKNGSLRMIMEVSSINFELRSEEEQQAIVQNFQQFLNSIDFPLQIVIQSRKLDITEYLKYIDNTTATLTNELLQVQAIEYSKYIKELSELANIMSKKFYIVIPFFVNEAATKQGGGVMGGFFKKSAPGQGIAEEQFLTYRNQLSQRTGLVSDGLLGLGIRTKILEEGQLKDLFFELYNPGQKPASQ